MARLTVLNYAIDGIDSTQAQRLIAVTRWLQRYAAINGDWIEPYFLASTEAENLLLAERMAAFRLPSPAAAQNAELEPQRYLALAKQWVWHSIGLLQPDLLIVDTWPRGAFGELLNAFDLCRKRIFIYSPNSPVIAEAPDFQAMLPLYDAILVPEEQDACSLPFGDVDPKRVHWLGPIMTRERVELLDRWEARECLGAQPDSFVVYVSVGSGLDPAGQEMLHSICAALMDEPDIHIVVGGAPLHYGAPLQGPRITWHNANCLEMMPGVDAAFCAAGYSAYHELNAVGVPTAWIPRSSLGDDQTARALRIVRGEAPIVLNSDDLRGAVLLDALDKLRKQRSLQSDGDLSGFRNAARDAAIAVLSTVWPTADVERAQGAVDDELLQAAADMSLPAHAVASFARGISGEPKPGAAATKATCTLFEALFAHALYPPLGADLIRPLCEILPPGVPEERVCALTTLLDEFSCFEDWSAVKTFLEALEPERTQALPDVRDAIIALLKSATSQGLHLQDVEECLSATRSDNPKLMQREAIAQLLDRLNETMPLVAVNS